MPKKGERSDPSNYRPITFTFFFSKIMESIIKRTPAGNALVTFMGFGVRVAKRNVGKISTKLVQAFLAPYLNVKDGPHSGQPVTNVDAILEKVEQNRHNSSFHMAEELGPTRLPERSLMNIVLICDSLLKHDETEPLLKRLLTGDEKCITYKKSVRRRS
ncbi:hypothetical protein EVAR_65806_1 [Eumeta japonica]|uniref:Uncharacterized protein n=1 Tax=Eumeta variegata TaxID=151549 RepID=A0A4C1ZUW6_EUMVA|nr:hypothetical protein EVAR_65806_1 [Eumeta japonica]